MGGGKNGDLYSMADFWVHDGDAQNIVNGRKNVGGCRNLRMMQDVALPAKIGSFLIEFLCVHTRLVGKRR